MLKRKPEFILYDGFEPSGRMHIAQGIFKAVNVNKCTRAGGTFIFWVADWFALMNDKMGGDLDKIRTVGQYFIEVWKATGMDMSHVRFHWTSDDIVNHAKEYWGQVLDIARRATLARIKKCCQIMGRKEDSLTAAQIMYPIMQCADIFFLKADICQLGVDQRKVNMLARDYCDWSSRKVKPVILSHHMLYGLAAGQAKMSKSNPDSAVFMEDSCEDVERKIRNAYCPREPDAAAEVDDKEMQLVKDDLMNPCLDYVKNILFAREGFVFRAGDKAYHSFEDVKEAFVSGEISETLLKDQLIKEVNTLLEPVRLHFKNDANARDLLAKITEWKKMTLQPPTALVKLQVKPPFARPIFVVFLPLPGTSIQLDAVLGVMARLQQAPGDHERVLWLEDWTANALGCVGGSDACIQGYYELFLFALRSLAKDLMQDTRVCWQGEMIVSGPSEYWISVINAGRKCSLDAIRKGLPDGESLEHAGQVFSTLMHISDVLALTGAPATKLCCDGHHENMHRLAAEHCASHGLTPPQVDLVEAPQLRLLGAGEGLEQDVNIMVTDTDVDVNRRMKKSFCMPQNVEFCPPITWVSELLKLQGGSFVVARKPDNGGDKTYTELGDLTQDFASGDLHPGDLKPAVARAVNALLEPMRGGLKEQDVLKKAQKDLSAHAKALTKKK